MNAHVFLVSLKRTTFCAAAMSAAYLAVPHNAGAQSVNRIDVAGVSDFGGGTADIPGAIPNSNGFVSAMVNAGGWTAGQNLQNNAVTDRGFVDPEKFSGGTDGSNFDRAGTAISYLSAHGSASNRDFSPEQRCHATSDCTNPPSGMGPRGACILTPGYFDANGANYGSCMYFRDRYIVVHSTNSIFSNLCRYSDGNAKWGESSNSGSWAGAGTNGGANLAVLDISHGTQPGFTDLDLLPTFGGMHLAATIMPIWGDTAMVSNRGSVFAAFYAGNPNSSVGVSWLSAMNNLAPQNDCLGEIGTPFRQVVYGGGRGVNGCGANIVVSQDPQADWSSWRVSGETWVNMKDDFRDSIGTGFWSYSFQCNYDCNTVPIQI